MGHFPPQQLPPSLCPRLSLTSKILIVHPHRRQDYGKLTPWGSSPNTDWWEWEYRYLTSLTPLVRQVQSARAPREIAPLWTIAVTNLLTLLIMPSFSSFFLSHFTTGVSFTFQINKLYLNPCLRSASGRTKVRQKPRQDAVGKMWGWKAEFESQLLCV